MALDNVIVRAEWDPEAQVWYVAETSLSGLNAEADTVEEFVRILPGMIQDLLEEDGMWDATQAISLCRWRLPPTRPRSCIVTRLEGLRQSRP